MAVTPPATTDNQTHFRNIDQPPQLLQDLQKTTTFTLSLRTDEQADCKTVCKSLQRDGYASLSNTGFSSGMPLSLDLLCCVEEQLVSDLNANKIETVCVSHTHNPPLELCLYLDEPTEHEAVRKLLSQETDQTQIDTVSRITCTRKSMLVALASVDRLSVPYHIIYHSDFVNTSDAPSIIKRDSAQLLDTQFKTNLNKPKVFVKEIQLPELSLQQNGISYFYRNRSGGEWMMFSLKPDIFGIEGEDGEWKMWCCELKSKEGQQRWQMIEAIMPPDVKTKLGMS
ncbi:hypothetical protein [Parashewanella tropica]|uniref:hypothetical protein n=1 Tax=Parashewanella tropica TaxID=2547970 RepID=UPI001059D12C|nr:hypothetical protein [Parashewanella tropica]